MENIPVYYGKTKPYDTTKAPIRQPLIFTWILGIGSRVMMLGKKYTIEKRNMDGLKPPYILLCSHNYFVDFYLQFIATFPHRSNTIATIAATFTIDSRTSESLSFLEALILPTTNLLRQLS